MTKNLLRSLFVFAIMLSTALGLSPLLTNTVYAQAKVRVEYKNPKCGTLQVLDQNNTPVATGGQVDANTNLSIEFALTDPDAKRASLKVNATELLTATNRDESRFMYTVGTEDLKIEAKVMIDRFYSIEFTTADPAEGTFEVIDPLYSLALENEEQVMAGALVYVKAIPVSGYQLTELKVNDVDIKKAENWNEEQKAYNYEIPVEAPAENKLKFTYKFEPGTQTPAEEKITVRFQNPENGTLTVIDADNANVPNEGKVKKNTTLTIKAEPAANYSLDELTANGIDFKANHNADTKMATYTVAEADVTFVATFKKIEQGPSKENVDVTLNVTGELNGDVKAGETLLVKGTNKIKKDAALKVTATPHENYHLKVFTIDGVNKINEATTGVDVTFNKAIVIDVEFEANVPKTTKFTVTYVKPENGTLEVKNGEQLIVTGATVAKGTLTVIAKPNPDFELELLKANDEDLTTKVDKKTFAVQYEVNANVTFKATFKKKGTAVEDIIFADVNLLPNPCNSVLYVNGLENAVRYELLTMQGTMVDSDRVATTHIAIATENLFAGIYLLRLVNVDGVSKIFRFVKQ